MHEPHPRIETGRSAIAPGQVIGLTIGVFFLVLGGVALARTGLDPTDLTAPHVSVGGFHHTPLLGLLEVLFGLLMLASAASPAGARSGLLFLGALAVAFGLVFAIQPEAFHATLGVHANTGWLYVLTGTVALIGALLVPTLPIGEGGPDVALIAAAALSVFFLLLVLWLLASEPPPPEGIRLPEEIPIRLPTLPGG